jgi:tripartite-type tricarboxylate transporter receptor subunit TctC
MASAGIGSSNHLSGELFKLMSGAPMLHVPYRGAAPALTDVIGGQVQVIFSAVPSTVEYIKADKVRALAVHVDVHAPRPCRTFPRSPNSYPATTRAIGGASAAPKNTPAAVVGKLNQEINLAAFADPKMKARLWSLAVQGSQAHLPASRR